MLMYPVVVSQSSKEACRILQDSGFPLTDHPSPEVTHLMLDVPSSIECTKLDYLLSMLPPNVTVIGGNIQSNIHSSYHIVDLLQDPLYLAKNAAITADCALRMAGQKMNRTYSDSTALVIGWGRIGKCLSRILQCIGCRVFVAARNAEHRAICSAMGYHAISIADIPLFMSEYTLIFNTAPHPVVHCSIPESCLAFDLASSPGIPEANCISARGLPGKMAPETSGKLIAETILRYQKEETV